MNTLFIKIKNMVPYIFLIAIYFFFINLEASKDKKYNKINEIKNEANVNQSNINDNNLTKPIQVIPFIQ